MTYQLLALGADDIEELFDWDVAISSQRDAFEALGKEQADQPPKLMLPVDADDSVALCYAARVSPASGAVSKLASFNPGNAARGLPTISALITVLDRDTGRPAALLDGTPLTTRRTAAGSAVAADLLARTTASRLAVLGSGTQALAHARALSRVRSFTEVRVWSPTPANRNGAADRLGAELDADVRSTETAEEAVRGACIVAACTSSREPVVRGTWLDEGCTVISVGSFQPDRCEADPEVITRSSAVVVDDVATGAKHAGPIVQGLAAGDLTEEDLAGLGDVASGQAAGRRADADIIYYNSVGLGIQDAAAAEAVVVRARHAGRGRTIAL